MRGRAAPSSSSPIALLRGGHALVEDVPGTGKTTLARASPARVGGTFQRVQATADLLPADITGSSVWDPGERAVRVRARARCSPTSSWSTS